MKNFKTESKKILDIMINSIYTHKEIFLRELISNASDAIDKLYYKGLTGGISGLNRQDFEIKIFANAENKTLTISDNGIGMTSEELEQNLGTIAKSGSTEFKENNEENDEIDIIGKFGVGFYSAFMVAKKVEVISRPYDSETAFLWRSSGAEGYEIKSAEKSERGTSVILYLKDDADGEDYDKYLEEYTLRSLIKKYSDYIRYPVKLLTHSHKHNDDGTETCTEEWETVNSMTPIWKKNKNEITDEEYDAFYSETFYDDAPLKVIHTSAEGGMMEYKALMFIPSHTPYNYYSGNFKKGLKLYSDGVLISDCTEELLPDYFSFVQGLVDSKLTLNISRETVQYNRQIKQIENNLEQKIKNALEDMLKNDREKYEKFFGAFGLQLKYGVYDNWGMHKELLRDLLLFRSLKDDKLITLSEYVAAMREEQTKIYYATGKSYSAVKCLPQCDKIADKGYDILCLTDDVDEFALKVMHDYDGKEFQNVSAENIREETELTDDKDMYDFIKEALNNEVSKVKGTAALKNHPVCLSSEGELSIEMEKVLSAMPAGEKPKADKVLELNVDSPVYAKLKIWFESDKEKLTKAAKVLYQQARLIEGLNVDNPTELCDAVCEFIAG